MGKWLPRLVRNLTLVVATVWLVNQGIGRRQPTVVAFSIGFLPSRNNGRISLFRLLGRHSTVKTDENNTRLHPNVTLVSIVALDDDDKDDDQAKKKKNDDFQARKAAWQAKYGSVQGLVQTFGGCSPWGDLDAEATRHLYHTLLPRSLWALQEADILSAEELAPLAYQARVAAKEYARLRSRLPNRLLAMAFDGYRSWKRNGNPLNTKGLTWQDLWDKYEAQIVQEEFQSDLVQGKPIYIDREALTKRIYMRILEKSCATNQAFDQMFLTKQESSKDEESREGALEEAAPTTTLNLSNLSAIASQLDHDVRDLLLHPDQRRKARKSIRNSERKVAKMERKKCRQAIKEAKREARQRRKIENLGLKWNARDQGNPGRLEDAEGECSENRTHESFFAHDILDAVCC